VPSRRPINTNPMDGPLRRLLLKPQTAARPARCSGETELDLVASILRERGITNL
jgi:hypothetical protein